MSDNNQGEKTIQDQRDKAGFWFTEDIAPGLKVDMILKRILESTESKYQKIDAIETFFGKTLVTDGKTQSAEFDEFVYHESLVHPSLIKSALLADGAGVSGPKSVFIGGGGELATAREVLRHESVERVVMVDLDKKVTDVCRKHLPEWGGDAVANNPRLELIFGDAYEYMLNTEEKFDVIIMDISDPIEAGPGIMLYTKEFYDHALTRLNMPHGVFVTQSGSADPIPFPHTEANTESDTTCFGPIRNTLSTIFDCVAPYSVHIPSFGGNWGYTMAYMAPPGSSETEKSKFLQDWCRVSDDTIDTLVADRIKDELGHYDGITHTRMFSLTKPLRKYLGEDKRIMTKDNPVFMY